MNYLLDKKTKRNKIFKLALSLLVLVVLFYFQSGIFYGLSFTAHSIFRSFVILGNSVGGGFKNLSSFLTSKKALFLENEQLKSEIDLISARVSNYNSLFDENNQLKETLGRKNEKTPMVLAAILSKPNQSQYDTLIIDVGNDKGVKTGNMVFVLGNVPIGRVAEVYSASAKVVLFSSAGEKTQVVISKTNVFVEAVGRGGGNFEIIMPRDFSLEKGMEIVLPGISPNLLGIIETIISDPSDSLLRALLVSPVNIQEVKFVEVQI